MPSIGAMLSRGGAPGSLTSARAAVEASEVAVTPQLYREIMACFPTGVAIVTAHEAGDRPRGLTLSAFCAVSLDPPLVLVCVDKGSNTLPALRESGGFTVNFLAGGREHLAVLYASKAEEKFDDIAWRRPELPE